MKLTKQDLMRLPKERLAEIIVEMMEGAVEGYVNYYEDSGGKLMAEAQVGCPYHIGDKVKIIILKDDERTPHNMD